MLQVMVSFLFSLANAVQPIAIPLEVNTAVFQTQPQFLDWEVGDENNYNINMGFLNGTMKMSVTEIVEKGIWLRQEIDLRIQQQVADVLIDPADGSIKRIVVDGQDQDIPDQGQMEVIEMKEDNVTVPAGNYDAIYVRVKNLDSGDESEQWVNPDRVAISGMVKSVSPSQFGQVVMELVSTSKE